MPAGPGAGQICKHKYINNQLTKPPLLDSLTGRTHPNEVRAWVKSVMRKPRLMNNIGEKKLLDHFIDWPADTAGCYSHL